jgi:hypothetical protein
MKQDSLQIPDKNINAVVSAEDPTFIESLHVRVLTLMILNPKPFSEAPTLTVPSSFKKCVDSSLGQCGVTTKTSLQGLKYFRPVTTTE